MSNKNKYFYTAILFAITEMIKVSAAFPVYTAIFNEEASEIVRFGNIGAAVSAAVFILMFILLKMLSEDSDAIVFVPSAAFFTEFVISAILLIIYKAREMSGFPSGFIVVLIAVMSVIIYIVPFIISETIFFVGYLTINSKNA